MNCEDRATLAVGSFLLWWVLPGLVAAVLVLTFCCQDFRESVFGPDYGNRSTPAYHGQKTWWESELGR